ncbi:MAG TPA: hypothetical protein VHW46_13225, partial [Terracidiphilus sp.]|nr:hypothetical protein [Terracidiphilus sp.]
GAGFSFVLAAFSSFKLVVSRRVISSWPSSSAQGDHGSTPRDFIMLARLSRTHDGGIQYLFVFYLAHQLVSFLDKTINRWPAPGLVDTRLS